MKKIILLTGSEGSIGQIILKALGKKYSIIQVDKKKKSKTNYFSCDMSNDNQVSRTFKNIKKKFDQCHILINCAGQIYNEPFLKYDKKYITHSINSWKNVLNNNLNSTFISSKFFVDNFCVNQKNKNEKLIINFSSVNAIGIPGQAAYSSSKSAIETFTKVLSKELGFLKIRVACIAPGYFNFESTNNNLSNQKKNEKINETPLRRFGKISELISAINFIINNKFYNGKILKIDGGL